MSCSSICAGARLRTKATGASVGTIAAVRKEPRRGGLALGKGTAAEPVWQLWSPENPTT